MSSFILTLSCVGCQVLVLVLWELTKSLQKSRNVYRTLLSHNAMPHNNGEAAQYDRTFKLVDSAEKSLEVPQK